LRAISRKDFQEWKVREAYIRQDGCCIQCGRTLTDGFHRHHKDGNPMNNSVDNLELRCPECHYKTFQPADFKEHKILQGEMLELLENALYKTLEGKMPGSTLERILEGVTRVLTIDNRMRGLWRYEKIPEFLLDQMKSELRAWIEGYKEGMKHGEE